MAARRERDDVLQLTAYAVVSVDWQSSIPSGRGYNIGAVLVDESDAIVFWSRNCVKVDKSFTLALRRAVKEVS